jgi:hypothetical protein
MKITRILLILAAALSLSLAVFGSIRNQSSTVKSSPGSIFNTADDGSEDA